MFQVAIALGGVELLGALSAVPVGGAQHKGVTESGSSAFNGHPTCTSIDADESIGSERSSRVGAEFVLCFEFDCLEL